MKSVINKNTQLNGPLSLLFFSVPIAFSNAALYHPGPSKTSFYKCHLWGAVVYFGLVTSAAPPRGMAVVSPGAWAGASLEGGYFLFPVIWGRGLY